jgi:cyclohexyl-isocyanide hydratase
MRIGLLLFPRMTQLDATGPYEIFARIPGAEVHLLAKDLAPVRSELGLELLPTCSLAGAPPLDVLCVPGGPGVNPLLADDEVLDALVERAQTARLVTSVCTGALVLGAAGLLRGYRATTHWLSLDLLPVFGATPVAERVVVDRDRATGGGVTAGIDIALRLAADLAGERAAQEIALLAEYAPAPPFPGSPSTAARDVVDAVAGARRGLQDERRRLCEAAVARRRL